MALIHFQDCTGNIFHAVRQAHHAGWRRVLLADSLTCEQLSRKIRPGRAAEVSLVIAETTNLHSEQDEQLIAKQVNYEDAKRLYFQREPIELPGSIADYEGGGRANVAFYNQGLPLFDPERPVFDPLTPADQARKRLEDEKAGTAIEAIGNMPADVAKMIEDAYHIESNAEKMTTAPVKFDLKRRRVPIHILMPMTSDEITELESKLNEQLANLAGEVRCQLYPWRGAHIASRHEVWRLYQRYFQNNSKQYYSMFIFVGWVSYDRSNPGTEVCLMQWDYHLPIPVRRLPINIAFEIWEKNTEGRVSVPMQSIAAGDTGGDGNKPPSEIAIDYICRSTGIRHHSSP